MNTRFLTIARWPGYPDVLVFRVGAARREPQVSFVLFLTDRPWLAVSVFGFFRSFGPYGKQEVCR